MIVEDKWMYRSYLVLQFLVDVGEIPEGNIIVLVSGEMRKKRLFNYAICMIGWLTIFCSGVGFDRIINNLPTVSFTVLMIFVFIGASCIAYLGALE